MGETKLSQAEADRLINMLKKVLIDRIKIPNMGCDYEFQVEGDTKRDLFIIRLEHGTINRKKYNLGARIMKNGTVLLQLHINPSNVHWNPDKEKIVGSHWHIYRENYGTRWAFGAEDISSDNFVDHTIHFLEAFHIIDKPDILMVTEM